MKNHGRTLAFCLTIVGLAAPTGAAFAQDPTPAAAPAEAAPAHHTRGGVSSGGAGLGVGAAAFVSGLAGPQVVYDFGAFHAEGLFGFDHRNGGGNPAITTNTFDLGLSGWYHLHVGDSSDFSAGGGLGFLVSSPSMGNSTNVIVLEPGVQMRAFVTQNVAIHARLGLSLIFGDRNVGFPGAQNISESFGIGGQLLSAFGFTYYFR
jgi:hypothetical protein